MDLEYSVQCEDYYPDWIIDLDPSELEEEVEE
jgi:hypothetical protein